MNSRRSLWFFFGILFAMAILALIVLVLVPHMHAQSTQPNCEVKSVYSINGTKAFVWDNRSKQCIAWSLSWFKTPNATVTVALQTAPDNGGTAGTWTTITADTTTANQNASNALYQTVGYRPWVQVLVTLSGSGSLNFVAAGYIQNPLGGVGGTGTGGGTTTTTVYVTPQQFATGASTCAGTGEDDTNCLLNMQSTLLQQQTTAIAAGQNVSFNIVSPPGLTYRYWNPRWLWGLKNVVFNGNGSAFLNTCQPGACGYLNPSIGSVNWPLDLNRNIYAPNATVSGTGLGTPYDTGYLINTMNPGDSTGSVITPTDLSSFRVGQWVMITSFDQQFSGFPPNSRYFDWAKIVSLNTPSAGNFTLDRAVSNLHSSAYPEQTTNSNVTGRARILNIDRPDVPFAESIELDNLTFLASLNASNFSKASLYLTIEGVYKFVMKNANVQSGFTITGGVHTASIHDSYIYYTELDKIVNSIDFYNCELNILSSASGVNSVTFHGGEFWTSTYMGARQTTYDGVLFKGATAKPQTAPEPVNNNCCAVLYSGPGPTKISVHNSILLGKNGSGDSPFGALYNAMLSTANQLLIDGGHTFWDGYSLTTTQAISGATNFFGCIEVGNPVIVTPPTADGLPRWGIVQKIYGGTGTWAADIQLNVPPSTGIPTSSTITCPAITAWDIKNNTYKNWIYNPATGANPPMPWTIRTNIENMVTNDGRNHNYWLDSMSGSYDIYNVVGYLKRITVTVDRPYTGSTGSPTFLIRPYGAAQWAQTESINIAVAGTRDITLAAVTGSQTGDSLTPINTPSWVNQLQFNWCGLGCATTNNGQSALVHITFEMDIPFTTN